MTTHDDTTTVRAAVRFQTAAAIMAGLFLVLAACAGETAKNDELGSASSALVTDPIRFAVTGDFGSATTAEGDVANLIESWAPDFVITTGDNNYPDGAASTIDPNIGQFYHSFIYPYTGSYGAGADQIRFFPSLGNHDWVTSGAIPYLNYFTLPGNERYYDFVRGPVHFFAVDSDPHEPDGTSSTSVQGMWLKNALAAATEPWKIVYFHHSPFSSGTGNGPSPWMQWPFQQWGATAVLSGHEHDYERFLINGFPYIVNGLGGEEYYELGPPAPGSLVRYTGEYGAILAQATSTSLRFQFFNRHDVLIDTYAIPSNPALTLSARLTAESGPVNGVIDPGERVTVGLALTNSAGSSTNLVGTLIANAGVTSPSAAQTYGAILGGATVEKTFSFTAAGAGGDTITASLHLQDGAIDLGTVSTTFVLATSNVFANLAAITIPAIGVASPYASKITVAGQPASPSKVTVTLRGVTHTYPDDIDVLLVGPTGQKLILMSDTGGGGALSSTTLTFDDAAASKLPDATQISAGTFKPTDFGSGDAFASPAPASPYATTLATFAGLNPNGDWSLYVVDDEAGDSGAIVGGWSLSFTYSGNPPPPPPPPPGDGGAADPNPGNNAALAIPDIGKASVYPSQIVVSGLAPSPTKVTVTLTGLSHTYPDDLDVLLVGPGGQNVVLLSDAGGGNAMSNVTLTFDDLAAAKLGDSSAISAGTWKPTDFATGDTFASPAPGGTHGATLSAFTGVNPNGRWSLYVLDDEAGDTGSLSGGWTLHFTY